MVRDSHRLAASSLERTPRDNSRMDFLLLYEYRYIGLAVSLKNFLQQSHSSIHTTIPSRNRCAVLLPSEPTSKSEKI